MIASIAPDDEIYGKWSVNFLTNPQGELDKVLMSLDEGEVTFTRKPDESLVISTFSPNI